MRSLERRRSDRNWMPWSAAGTAPHRAPRIKPQVLVESLEPRYLLSSIHFKGGANAGPTFTDLGTQLQAAESVNDTSGYRQKAAALIRLPGSAVPSRV